MELRICIESQQGASYGDILRVAEACEAAGFTGFFVSDHYLQMPWKVGAKGGLPGPTDAWITLAGLARDTTKIRLGTLLTAATFREPVPLAIAVAEVDEMSGGRTVFGLGAGWVAEEHRVQGLAYRSVGERFDRLEEQLEILTGFWSTPIGETFSFNGLHYTVTDSPALPKPLQRPGPPIIVGGSGPRRTPALAARFATEYNAPFLDPVGTAERFAVVEAACLAIGRDPATLARSCGLIVCCGEDVEVIERRAAAIELDPDVPGEGVVIGSPDRVIEALLALEKAGAEIAYLEIDDLTDLDHVAFLGETVVPAFA